MRCVTPNLGHRDIQGSVLNPEDSIRDLDGDTLTGIAEVPLLAATDLAFASWTANGLTTWGDPTAGGECNQQLSEVEKVG